MLNFSVEGIDRVDAEMRSFGSSVADCLEDAVIAGGMILTNQGGENAPYKSGTLKSATVAPPRITRIHRFRVEGRVGPRGVPYARIQEYGGLTGRGHRTRIQGKFYMTRAVASHQRAAEEEMVRVFREGINA